MLTKPLEIIRVLGKNEDKKEIISKLQHLGVVHLKQTDLKYPFRNDEVLPEIDVISNILLQLNYLAIQAKVKRDTRLEGLPGYEKIKSQAQDFISKHYTKVTSLVDRRKDLKSELKELKSHLNILKSIPFNFKIPKTNKIKFYIFKSKKRFTFDFKYKVKVTYKKGYYYYAITLAEKDNENFINYIKRTPLKSIDVSFVKGSMSNQKEEIEFRVTSIVKELKIIETELFRKLNGKQSKLAFLIAVLKNYREQAKSMRLFKQTKHLFAIEGYIERRDIQKVKDSLIDVMISIKPANKFAPTKLMNNNYSKSFQMLTELFATPSYKSVDPTFFISFFFPLFFGIMLSDVGYGIALLILVAILKSRLEKDVKFVSKIFFWSALSSIFFGFLFGSFFGNLIKIPALFMDSFSASFIVLKISLIIGLIHLNLAVGLNIYQKIIQRKKIDEIFFKTSSFPVVEIACLAFYLDYLITGIILLVIALIILIKEKSIFGIMDVSGYFGTWFSYARLLALSLATVGVALAINVVAKKLIGFGFLGIILAIIVIIGGHTFNFLLSILGCSIHAARLHYVEFFSFFYEGEGVPFEAFKIITEGGKK